MFPWWLILFGRRRCDGWPAQPSPGLVVLGGLVLAGVLAVHGESAVAVATSVVVVLVTSVVAAYGPQVAAAATGVASLARVRRRPSIG